MNSKQSEKLTYEQAIKHLEDLVCQVESGQLGIDQITLQLKEAKSLISHCKNILFKTEEEVRLIMEDTEK